MRIGITDSGVREMTTAFARDGDIEFIVFATPTTIEEGVYGDRLRKHGVPDSQVIEQACPGLVDVVIHSLSNYIGKKAPATLCALKNFNLVPELCGEVQTNF